MVDERRPARAEAEARRRRRTRGSAGVEAEQVAAQLAQVAEEEVALGPGGDAGVMG